MTLAHNTQVRWSMDKKFIVSCLISLLLCFCFYLQPFKLVVIVGQSMMPTLRNGQVVLAKRESKYNKGDIVVIKDNPEDGIIVKRILFTPGDYYYHIIDSDNFEMIYLLDNSFRKILEAKSKYGNAVLEYKLGKDDYFVVGDNYNNSDDSRRFGPIKRENIIYKIVK